MVDKSKTKKFTRIVIFIWVILGVLLLLAIFIWGSKNVEMRTLLSKLSLVYLCSIPIQGVILRSIKKNNK